MKRLSIIVPIYNVEPYIERCLRSLEDQDISKNDYEIICVNDGSPDNSRDLVVRLQKEFDNITLIDQENQGVSLARNNGIDIAKGKYLLMVDPDDLIEANALKDKLEILDRYDLDVGITGFVILNEAMVEEYRYDPVHDNTILSGIEYSYRIRGRSDTRLPHRSWAIFIRRKFLNINELRYLAEVPYLEDGEFMARVLCIARKVCFLNNPFYIVTIRSGSATRSNLYHSERARSGFYRAALNLLEFKNNKQRSEKQKIFLNQPIIHFTTLYIISIKFFSFIGYYPQILHKIKGSPLKKLETKGCSDSYEKFAVFYNRSLLCFYLYWQYFRFRRSMGLRFKKMFQ